MAMLAYPCDRASCVSWSGMFVLITLRGMSQRSYGEIALALMLFTSWARFYCNIGFLVRVFGDV